MRIHPVAPRGMPSIEEGLHLHQAGDLASAREVYEAVLAADPDHPDALHLLGVVAYQTGDFARAAGLIGTAIALAPSVADYRNDLGSVYKDWGRHDEAVACFGEALALAPGHALAAYNLGVIHQKRGRRDAARQCFRTALGTDPAHVAARYNLGCIERDEGNADAAIAIFRETLGRAPGFAEAWNGLGLVLHERDRYDEAIDAYRSALAIAPGFAAAHANLGNVLEDLTRLGEAGRHYRSAAEANPGLAEAWHNLGVVAKDQGLLEEAEAAYRRAIEIDPGLTEALGNLLFLVNYLPDRGSEAIYSEYRRWNEIEGAPLARFARPHDNTREPARRLRVGYVSPDFRQHPARSFIEPLLAHHHERAVEIFCYAEVKAPDEATGRFRAMADHWVDTVGLSDEALAEKIRADRIDILVDLAGHTRGNRLAVFARKPAPVQFTWLGFGYTTGLTAIDFFLGDPRFVPAGAERFFSESVWRLPRTAFVYRPPEGMPEVGPLPALANGHVTFGSFSRTLRFNHKVIALWARVLRAVPGSRLVLNNHPFLDPDTRELFHRRFAEHGVDPARVELIHTAPQPMTWGAYGRIDLTLDPFPHNAGTTTFESLWMGVPVISMLDRPPMGRFGATILGNAGLEDWLAANAEAYVAIAVEKTGDLAALARLRAGLRQRLEACPLRDEEAFARDVEKAYRRAWRGWIEDCPG